MRGRRLSLSVLELLVKENNMLTIHGSNVAEKIHEDYTFLFSYDTS